MSKLIWISNKRVAAPLFRDFFHIYRRLCVILYGDFSSDFPQETRVNGTVQDRWKMKKFLIVDGLIYPVETLENQMNWFKESRFHLRAKFNKASWSRVGAKVVAWTIDSFSKGTNAAPGYLTAVIF